MTFEGKQAPVRRGRRRGRGGRLDDAPRRRRRARRRGPCCCATRSSAAERAGRHRLAIVGRPDPRLVAWSDHAADPGPPRQRAARSPSSSSRPRTTRSRPGSCGRCASSSPSSRRSSRSPIAADGRPASGPRSWSIGMLRTTTLTPMAHLTCVAHSRLELAEILVDLPQGGIENLLALGGDPPTDEDAGPGELMLRHRAGRAGPRDRRLLRRRRRPSPSSTPARRTCPCDRRSPRRQAASWPTSASPSSSSGPRTTSA